MSCTKSTASLSCNSTHMARFVKLLNHRPEIQQETNVAEVALLNEDCRDGQYSWFFHQITMPQFLPVCSSNLTHDFSSVLWMIYVPLWQQRGYRSVSCHHHHHHPLFFFLHATSLTQNITKCCWHVKTGLWLEQLDMAWIR